MAREQYGAEHRETRDRLISKAHHTPCPICGTVMVPGMALDLDHDPPLAVDPNSKGVRIVCATCNRSAGGRLGRARQQRSPSRVW